MLTAISVARECAMIEKPEKVIVVTTEADTAGYEIRDSQKQTLFYSYETKSVSKTVRWVFECLKVLLCL